ncbi:MAG: hypothetical protein AB1656_22095 [Candidatus Omnitrophota bacterium]
MLRFFKAFLHDSVSWILLVLLGVTVVVGLATLVNRYDRVDRYDKKLYLLEYDILNLKKDVERKKIWAARLVSDHTAWEQVARDKMNYLGPDEVLVTFVPAQKP